MTSQKFKPVDCNRGCGQLVYFDRTSENGWSQTGKMVPLQWSEEKGPTDEGHQCPNSDYNKRRMGGQQTTAVGGGRREPPVPSGTEMILGNTLDILSKIELVLQRVEAQAQLTYSIRRDMDKLIKAQLGESGSLEGTSETDNDATGT
jgi:hypothetical protein